MSDLKRAKHNAKPMLCHLSGNWARVAIDTYTRYTERCPDRTLMQFSAPGLPVYSSSPSARDENLAAVSSRAAPSEPCES